MSSQTGEKQIQSREPRAVVHKQILEAAESNPDVSMEELSGMVTGASTALVERVLNEYGDPGTSDDEDPEVDADGTNDADGTATQGETGIMSDATNPQRVERGPDVSQVTDKQREILDEIRANPEATQDEIADRVDSSQATVSNHLRSLPDFEWQNRQEFVESMSNHPDTIDESSPRTGTEDQLLAELSALSDKVEALQHEQSEYPSEHAPPFGDLELASKVVHACLDAETITDEEELEIIKRLLQQ
jgi:DNA-binding CsgD family transcriptional regulator